MKDLSPFPLDDSESERFIDASLREHARLGAADQDSDLVRSILMETVERKASRSMLSNRRSEERKLWVVGIASAAAILGAFAAVLATLPFKSDSRQVDEIRFIVQYGEENPESRIETGFSAPLTQRDAVVFSNPTSFPVEHAPLDPGPLLATDPLISLESFEPSFREIPLPGFREDSFEIVADKTTVAEDQRIYEGNVEVVHDDFRLTSDRVVLLDASADQSEESIHLTADNAILEHRSPGRTALAGEIDYEPTINRFSLRRVVYVDSAEGRLNSFQENDIVYLMGSTLVVRNAMQP